MLDRIRAEFGNHPVYSKQEKVRLDILKRFGYYSTESNGHLSEYVSWYRKRPEEIEQWIDTSDSVSYTHLDVYKRQLQKCYRIQYH